MVKKRQFIKHIGSVNKSVNRKRIFNLNDVQIKFMANLPPFYRIQNRESNTFRCVGCDIVYDRVKYSVPP